MSSEQAPRTQAEILTRFMHYARSDSEDFMGFSREVLIASMTRETLINGVGLDDTDVDVPINWMPECAEDAARAYLVFAVEKILDHRGISAGRSVAKMREYAWLLGRDDVVQAMNDVDYTNYGAPKIKAFADGMSWPWTSNLDDSDVEQLNRMASGLPCVPDCNYGCGQ